VCSTHQKESGGVSLKRTRTRKVCFCSPSSPAGPGRRQLHYATAGARSVRPLHSRIQSRRSRLPSGATQGGLHRTSPWWLPPQWSLRSEIFDALPMHDN
jgi:hypothetical protein